MNTRNFFHVFGLLILFVCGAITGSCAGGSVPAPAAPAGGATSEKPALASGGYEGIVTDHDTGNPISDVEIVFESPDGAVQEVAWSNKDGWYTVSLAPGSYMVTASHKDYNSYSTGSGFFVVSGSETYTGNITMWPLSHVGAPYETRPAPPGPPTVEIAVTPNQIAGGQTFVVTLTGTDDAGLDAIWWWGHQTGDNELDKAHWHDCAGQSTCEYQSEASSAATTSFYLCANARDTAYGSGDGQAHQASEGMGIPCALVEIGQAGSTEKPPEEAGFQIAVDGSGHTFGPLPVIFYALTEPTGQDIYPLGEGAYVLFGLYDSGSNKVRISKVLPNRVAGPNWDNSDTGHLNLNNVETVNLRLNGLQTRQSDGSVPIDAPGTAAGPQIEVGDIAVKPDNVNVTLIGVPVINKIVAYIDYTKLIDDPAIQYAQTGVQAPYIAFYWPGDPAIPIPDVALQLEPFGNLVSTDGATPGQRYWLRNVAFQSSGNVVSDQQREYDFLFDTGTTVAIVGDRVANGLDLSSTSPSFDCYGGTGNGYVLDAVTMVGSSGSYQIKNAAVCWANDQVQTGDAVIGSNFFDQVQIVLDGPGGVLGIIGGGQGVSAPTPQPPPSAEPVGCGGVEVGGYCWHLGAESVSCDTVCASYGGYDEATRTYAGSDGTSSNCRTVLETLGIPLDDFFETAQGGIGCFGIKNTSGNYFGYWDSQPTTASATYGVPGRNRVCACQH